MTSIEYILGFSIDLEATSDSSGAPSSDNLPLFIENVRNLKTCVITQQSKRKKQPRQVDELLKTVVQSFYSKFTSIAKISKVSDFLSSTRTFLVINISNTGGAQKPFVRY